MNNAYKIIKLRSDRYACIIIPMYTTNPLENVDKLVEQLKNEHLSSERILFDFIVSMGNSNERYMSAKFDGECISSPFKCVDIKSDDPIRKASSDFLRMKLAGNEPLILRGSQVSLLKKGFTL